MAIRGRFLIPAFAVLILASTLQPAGAGSIFGRWLRPATGVVVQVFSCGGGLGVKVLKSQVRARIGKVYMCGAKRASDGTFWGKLRNPEDNGIYSGGARLIKAGLMKISGCIPNTGLCRSEVWRRLR